MSGCQCTLTLQVKVKLVSGCADEDSVCRDDAVVAFKYDRDVDSVQRRAIRDSALRHRGGAPRSASVATTGGDTTKVSLLRGDVDDDDDDDGDDAFDVDSADSSGAQYRSQSMSAVGDGDPSSTRQIHASMEVEDGSIMIKRAAAAKSAHKAMTPGFVRLCCLAFFWVGVCLALPYGSIMFRLPFWVQDRFSPSVWPLMVSAYNAPGLFVLLLQKATDTRFERWFSMRALYAGRMGVPFAISTLALVVLPLVTHDKFMVLTLVFVLGACNAAVYAWAYNLASIVRPVLAVLKLGGAGLSGFMVIAIAAVTRIQPVPPPTHATLEEYWWLSAAVTASGGVVLQLFLRSPRVRDILLDPELIPNREGKTGPAARGKGSDAVIAKLGKGPSLADQIRPMLLIGGATNFVNVLFASMVTYIPSATGSTSLPVDLLLTNYLSYFVGSESYVFVKFGSTRPRLYVLFAVVALMFVCNIYYVVAQPFLNDTFTLVFSGLAEFMMAQANSSAYGLVLEEVPLAARPRALTLETIAIYSGTISAVFANFALPALLG